MLGDLYLKTTDAQTIANGTYDLRTEDGSGYLYWLDCYKQWGVSFDDGALDALMGFRPNKEPVVNKNVTAQGAYYVTGAGLVDDRNVSVPFHIVAMGRADFLLKRAGFYNAVKAGLLTFKIVKPLDAIYKVYYTNCTQYTQFLSGMAKFLLGVYETNGDHDGDEATPQPMPVYADMSAYLHQLLSKYGGLATEEAVRNIVRNYTFNGHPVTRWPLDNR